MNYDKYTAVIDHIERNPRSWNQWRWCGSKCCIAGHAQAMFGDTRNWVVEEASKVLGLNASQAGWLFHGERTLDDFRRVRVVQGWAHLAASR